MSKEAMLVSMARLVTETTWEQIPEKEKLWARLAFCDFTAVALAGSTVPVVQNLHRWLQSQHFDGRSVLIGTNEKTDAVRAALLNGTAAHALDYDDVSWTTIGHPTVSVAPVALACAQERGDDGKAVIQAYILGVEVMHRIARLTMPALSERGWHTTPVYGVFGAAAAACFIYGASLMETVNALAIAASRAGGVRGNFGTQTKALHAGLSAADGIECAQMAMCGITGSSGVIEKADGFAKCFVGSCLPKNDEVTNEWDLEKNGLVFKRYPCCSGSHPANDVWDEYVRKTNLQAEYIEKIEAGLSLLGPRELNCHFPENAVAAKFSLEFALASRVVFGPLCIGSFTDEKVRDERVRMLMKKITVSVDKDLAELGFIGTAPVRLTVYLKNGVTAHLACDLAEGNPEKPLSEATRHHKFEDCFQTAKVQSLTDAYWRALQKPEEMSAAFVGQLGQASVLG